MGQSVPDHRFAASGMTRRLGLCRMWIEVSGETLKGGSQPESGDSE